MGLGGRARAVLRMCVSYDCEARGMCVQRFGEGAVVFVCKEGSGRRLLMCARQAKPARICRARRTVCPIRTCARVFLSRVPPTHPGSIVLGVCQSVFVDFGHRARRV